MNTSTPRRIKRRTLLVGGIVGAILLGGLAVVAWRVFGNDDTRLQQALSLAPEDAARISWTDWSAVRRVIGADVDADSSDADLADFLSAAFDRDLSSTSTMVSSASVLHERLGFSPASVDWELFAQSEAGASVLLHLPDDVDIAAIGPRLEAVGYDENDGTYANNSTEDPITAEVSGEFAFISLLPDEGLIVASDSQEGVDMAADSVAAHDSAPLPRNLTDAVGTPLSAALYAGDRACAELAMAQADEASQAEADNLLAAAGEVNPLQAFAMAVEPDGSVAVAMGFDTQDQAEVNAQTRSRLASGPAPGQGGEFADRFTLGEVTAADGVVTMRLEPADGAYVLSDLSTGPLLFATC